jgi:hypothetical protein
VDLGFDYQIAAPNGARSGFRLFSCSGNLSLRTGHIEFFEQLLSLILVDIHDIIRDLRAIVGTLGGCIPWVKVLITKLNKIDNQLGSRRYVGDFPSS